MKLRIKRIYGVWHCGIKGVQNRYLGIGFTPCVAYWDWVRYGRKTRL